MIRALAIGVAVWCLLSVLFAVGWARFMSRLDAMDDADVVAEAERILDAEFDRMWGL